MKIQKVFACLLSACPAVAGLAQTQSFLKPTLAYVDTSVEGYSSATAIGMSGGVYLGEGQQHELSFDWFYTHWDEEFRSPWLNANLRERYMPYLFNYKVRAPGEGSLSNVMFYFGPSAGWTQITTEGSASGYINGSDSHTDWVLSYGGTVGFTVSLSQRLELDVGYRYLRTEAQDDFDLGGVVFYEGVSASTHVIYVGLGIKF